VRYADITYVINRIRSRLTESDLSIEDELQTVANSCKQLQAAVSRAWVSMHGTGTIRILYSIKYQLPDTWRSKPAIPQLQYIPGNPGEQ
jgi:hypothetical protein